MEVNVQQQTTFKLDQSFINKYKNKKPPFGFNGLGELVYYRTYSRLICDECQSYEFEEDDEHRNVCSHCGTEMRNEKWFETVRRVVEGTYSIQLKHITRYGLGWKALKAQRSAQEMYDRIFTMKFLPPGRGLWAMGTPLIEKRHLYSALNNCAFVSTASIDKDRSKPFRFLMDMSMLGVGVGFDVEGAGKTAVYQPVYLNGHSPVYQIPDTREGWVESVGMLIDAFFVPNSPMPTFKYDKIREAGLPIKTFGGKSSGPEPLIKLHDNIKQVLTKRIGSLLTITDITDIMNFIGICVVAGNVRRSAELVLGPADNKEYSRLKDYQWKSDPTHPQGGYYVGAGADRAQYGWASNNSILAELGMDYTNVATQTAKNGEPGYAYLKNMQDYGRMCDPPNYKDQRAVGTNPCGEQTLESYELCCLVESFPLNHDTLEDYIRTLKFAYLYAKTVTLGQTHWPETNRVMLRNRRIGTSQSGIIQTIEKLGIDEYKRWCEEGYDAIEKYDEVYSEWLCVPKSNKKTSIKPSGTVSLLAGATPGMHWPENKYYIRRMRLADNSPLLDICHKIGYKIEKDLVSSGTMVVEIPVHIEGVSRTVKDVSIWEQVSLAAFLQKYWADNQVSCTVTFQQQEADQIQYILPYFQYQLKGISFLPQLEAGAFAQMPYEAISQQKYQQLAENLNVVSFEGISEDSVPEKYCDGDSCVL